LLGQVQDGDRVSNSPPAELIGFLRPYDRAVQELALGLRELVLEEMAPCHENIYDAYSAVAIGYGPSDRLKDCICHIAVYEKHVNLGFNRGTTLDDPQGVLKGTGKWTRHITLKSLSDLERPEIAALLRRAREQAPAVKDTKLKPGGVISVVKAIYPKKRRPHQ
jgi:Domain of unknown function (DU1801)